MKYELKIKWTVSRARSTAGYNVCSLYVNGKLVARCNGGGYDMKGTVLGNWIARQFPDRLNKLTKEFYGLSYHDPDFDPARAIVPGTGKTVEEREKSGDSIGLERYQAFYRASNKLPTVTHTVPLLDGACGWNCMERVLEAIGGSIECKNDKNYVVTMKS